MMDDDNICDIMAGNQRLACNQRFKAILLLLVASFGFGIELWFLESLNSYPVHGVKKYFEENNMKLLEWVCIQPPNGSVTDHLKNKCNPQMRDLVAFNAKSNYIETVCSQTVRFTTKPIPKEYKIYHLRTAIFNGFSKRYFPFNIFHFIVQYFIPFYHMLDVWKRSNSTWKADIFYYKPLTKECMWRSYSKFFLDVLDHAGESTNFGYNYHAHPGKLCYRYGLFSDGLHKEHSQSAIDFVRHYYGMNKKKCPVQNSVILSMRDQSRVWSNIEQVKKALVAAGYVNTRIVNFSWIPLKEQLKTVYCAEAFIAAHSAAMEWAFFMRPNSTAIEIAWPDFGWHFFYTTNRSFTYGNVPLNFVQLETRNVTNINGSIRQRLLESPSEKMLSVLSLNVTVEEKMKMKYRLVLGKHCNFSVDPVNLVNILHSAVPVYSNAWSLRLYGYHWVLLVQIIYVIVTTIKKL